MNKKQKISFKQNKKEIQQSKMNEKYDDGFEWKCDIEILSILKGDEKLIENEFYIDGTERVIDENVIHLYFTC